MGTPLRAINAPSIRRQMMIWEPEISFFALNLRGNSLTVTAHAGVQPPETAHENEVASIVAKQDGVIKSIEALRGASMVAAGDAVHKGDVLIDGCVLPTREGGKAHFVRSDGRVYAYTRRSVKAVRPLERTEKCFTGKAKTRLGLCIAFRGKNYFIGRRISGGECEKTIERRVWQISESVRFPVSLEVQTYRYYEPVPCIRTAEDERTEMLRLALGQTAADMDMTFEAFVELYTKDVRPRLKENTWLTKENIIQKKILPYFGKRKISEITTKDVIAWQNELLAYRDEQRKPYSQTYLKTLHNQLSAIFNHAVRFYELRSNPAAKAGNMGTEERKEMLFWTKAEYQRFAEAMMDKPLSYYAFEMLYWCGIREGELLALTPADFDFEAGTVKINKSYQRLHGEDVITSPKTKKSNRTIKMPNFLCDEMRDYLGMLYGVKKKDRIFTVTKSYLHHEMDRGAKEAGVKRIRIHDLRHSHISLLIDMGFSAVAIADRVGHESIEITYRYAHLFPSKQTEMADKLDFERTGA